LEEKLFGPNGRPIESPSPADDGSDDTATSNQIGGDIEAVQTQLLPTLTKMAGIVSEAKSSVSSRASQVSPQQRQQLYSLLVACLNQSAAITGNLQLFAGTFASKIVTKRNYNVS